MSTTDDSPHSTPADRTERPDSNCVSAAWEISLVLSSRWTMPVRAHFTYRSADPYAVQLDFYLDTRRSVRWTFARDLLTTGLVFPAGCADVQVWPADDGMGVHLCLESPQGEALFEIPLAPLSRWLGRTYQLVPPGEEPRHLSLDTRLERLLQETPYSSRQGSPERDCPANEQPDEPHDNRAGTDSGPEGECRDDGRT